MLLFVYGTLQKDCENHSLLKNSRFVSEAYIHGSLYDLGVGFPAVVDDHTRSQVVGEVYEVKDDILSEMDQFEGYDADNLEDSLYIRSEADAYLPDRTHCKVQVYFIPPEQLAKFFAQPLKQKRWRG